MTRTTATLLSDPVKHKIFRDDYTEVGFTKPYVLHAILAVSALHLYHLQPTEPEYIAQAIAHHDAAIRLVQPSLVKLTEAESIPVFAFTAMTAIYSLAETSHNRSPEVSRHRGDPIDEMLSCFQLQRGVKAVIAPFYWYLCRSWMGTIIQYPKSHGDPVIAEVKKNIPNDAALMDMANSIADPPSRDAYIHAVDTLLDCIAIVAADRTDSSRYRFVLQWPIDLAMEVLDDIKKREERALVLLAYYTVAMSMSSDKWWLSKWPRILLPHILDILGNKWAEVLQWPRDVVLRGQNVFSKSEELRPAIHPALPSLLEEQRSTGS